MAPDRTLRLLAQHLLAPTAIVRLSEDRRRVEAILCRGPRRRGVRLLYDARQFPEHKPLIRAANAYLRSGELKDLRRCFYLFLEHYVDPYYAGITP